MTIKTTMQRLAAGAGAIALAMAGAVAMGTAASADQGADGTPPGEAADGTTGTLVVHKYAGSPTSNESPNGTSQDVDRPPLAGVTFDLCLVDDLSADGAWEGIADVAVEDAECDGDVTSLTTGDDGIVSFAGLEIGLYKVVESAFPDGVTPGLDFLVSIPYPSAGSDDTWLWTVHAYPKNAIEGDGEKTVEDPSANGLGSTIPWTITTRPIGSFNDGAPVDSYGVKDSLDSRLTYVAGSARVYVVSASGVETELTGSEFVLTAPAGPGGDLIIDFDADYVNGLPAGTTFKITFDTTVTSVGNGIIENSSTEYVNDDEDDFTTGVVTTEWGAAKLLKHETNAEGKVLAGAEFQVYDVNEDGTCTAPLQGEPLEVSDEDTFESDAAGVVNIPGLYVGKNGEPVSADYCVVETKAPAGYTLVDTPIKITVTPGAVADGSWSAKVPNLPTEGPELPLTGAQGTLMMTIGGLLLVGVGAGAIVVSRRRNA